MARSLAFLLVLVLVAACGGSSSGGDGDTTAPNVEIWFPGLVALTDGPTVTVRGIGLDTSTITQILVNGVAATSTDGFATWIAPNVPLVLGANIITIDTTDNVGNNNPAAATINVTRDPAATTTGTIGAGTAFVNLQDVVIDEARNRLLYLDDNLAGPGLLGAVDLATGNRTVVSQDAIGGGSPPMMDAPVALGPNLTGSVVYVTDSGLDMVIVINIISGVRAVISDSGVGGAPNFPFPEGIAYNNANNSVYWVNDSAADNLLRAAIPTGNTRTIVSDNAGPIGLPNFDEPNRIVLDPGSGRALVTNLVAAGAILGVNLTTGVRTTIASTAVGSGGPAGFAFPTGLGLDLVANRVVTQLEGSDATVYVNLLNGNRTTISQNGGPGIGPNFNAEVALAYDALRARVYVLDVGTDAVYVVDGISGDRVILSR